MKQQLKETIIYKPNDEVTVTVSNKPVMDEKSKQIYYEQVATFKFTLGWMDSKLSFTGEDDMRKFLDDVVLEDPQQELPLPL